MKKSIKYSIYAGLLVSFSLLSLPTIAQAATQTTNVAATSTVVNDPDDASVEATQTTTSSTPVQKATTSQSSLTDVDGLFTVGNQNASLTDQTGTQTSNRSVLPGVFGTLIN